MTVKEYLKEELTLLKAIEKAPNDLEREQAEDFFVRLPAALRSAVE
jgi:hypothetical protein